MIVSMDRGLTCADCSQQFTFTASEQDFYAERNFSEPRRCAACRQIRKAQRGDAGGSSNSGGYASGGGYSSGAERSSVGAGSYSSGGGSSYGSGGGYSSGGGGGYSDRGARQMFDATCSGCGQLAKVPFQPTNGKPVYCTDCFSKRRG